MNENPLVKRLAMASEIGGTQTPHLGPLTESVRTRVKSLEEERFAARLWRKDASLWKSDPKEQEAIRNSLGWLHGPENMEDKLEELFRFRSEVKAAGFEHVLYMGMGGSSLAPLSFQRTFSPGKDGIPLAVLDTTDPWTIRRIEKEMPVRNTLFIVASKSGTTAESIAFSDYFYAKLYALKAHRAGENFVAITDSNTPLVKRSEELGYRRVFLNFPDVGGRYSALSYFGMVPAVLMGLDVSDLLTRAARMEAACSAAVPESGNPGILLGAAMGELARRGRDKVTFLLPESIKAFGLWFEQLLAESTGKEGRGILPVVGEPPGPASVYGEDRLFVAFRLKDETDQGLEERILGLEAAGQPVVSLPMEDRLDMGKEFFRWEIATATAGAVLGINPFGQPNVQESKENTNRLLAKVRQGGRLPEPLLTLKKGPLRFYEAGEGKTAEDCLRRFFGKGRPGDFIALQAYLPETAEIERTLQTIRERLRDGLRLSTTLGYGPRYLHSTGQYHKGGPNKGLFLQLVSDDSENVEIPGLPYTFGVFKQAQALGDLQALLKHKRRVIRINLGQEIVQGLEALRAVIEKSLK